MDNQKKEDPLPSCCRKVRTGIGQDSHRFLPEDSSKPCLIGGVLFEEMPGLSADSDGDVVFHAICNAITSVAHEPVMGKIAIELCHKDGITDSSVYLERALETLGNQTIEHVALAIEGKRPKLQERIPQMREKIASFLQIDPSQVGITAISGNGLTEFGLGNGLFCTCVLTTIER